MKQLLLISGCFFLLLISCQKEKLPKLTEEGENTFGCKVNGKNWVPHGVGGFGGTDPIAGGFFENINTIYIRAYNKNETIQFYLKDVFNTGKYLLNFTTVPMPDNLYPKNYGLYSIRNNSIEDLFITTITSIGEITITNLDTTNKIVSGTFEFTGVDNNGKSIKVSDGRFDIKSH